MSLVSLYPKNLRIVEPNELEVDWSDGQIRRYRFSELRAGCPCATCREKRRGEVKKPADSPQLNILSAAEARPLRVVAMKPVGNYAYTIVFSDGHDTGIFPFDLLRELGQVVA